MSEFTIIAAGEEQRQTALSLRREMLAQVNGVSESEIDGRLISGFGDYLATGEQTTLLAFCGDKAVGCATICYLTVVPTFSHPTGKRAHIMNVYTRAEYRRQGAARLMLSALIDEAKRRGVTYISLDATESGKPLYRSLGFEASGENMGLNLF